MARFAHGKEGFLQHGSLPGWHVHRNKGSFKDKSHKKKGRVVLHTQPPKAARLQETVNLELDCVS